MRTVIATIGAAVLGAAVLFWGTGGLQAYTAETARRLAVAKEPRPLPTGIPLQTQTGEEATLDQLQGKLVVAGFFYSNCRATCLPLALFMSSIRNELLESYDDSELHFVSISFDPDRDDPEQLSEYGGYYHADPKNWWVVRPLDDLERLMQEFGVVAIPVGDEFSHNAALYLIDRQGRLTGIFDWDAPQEVIAAVHEQI